MQIGARLFLASCLLVWSGAASWGDDGDPPTPTQDEVRSNTQTAVAPGQTEKAPPPTPIHPLSKSERKALKDTGHRVFSGKDWRAITPEQRDDVIRGLRDNNAPGTIFMIDVRTGDIYKFDPLPAPTDPNKSEAQRLSELYGVPIRAFNMETDMAKLPVSVGNNPSSQSDRSSDFVFRGPPIKP